MPVNVDQVYHLDQYSHALAPCFIFTGSLHFQHPAVMLETQELCRSCALLDQIKALVACS